MRTIAALGTAWSVTILGGGLVLALIAFKRWRHLAMFLVYLTALTPLGAGVYPLTKRPHPPATTDHPGVSSARMRAANHGYSARSAACAEAA